MTGAQLLEHLEKNPPTAIHAGFDGLPGFVKVK